MIWLTWRQHRTEALIAAAALALVAAVLVPTGLQIASDYDDAGVAACLGDAAADCSARLDDFANRWHELESLMSWFNFVPVLIGSLIAAPFVLEFERGTFRLAWTQSVTRRRWLTIRLALIVVSAVVAGLLFAVLMTWWRDPLDAVGGRLADGFEFEGLAPAAYTLFAAALVVAIGVVLRRTGAAIGLAVIVFLAVRIAVEAGARPHYREPVQAAWTNSAGPDLRHAWILDQQAGLRVADGRAADPATAASCMNPASKSGDPACLAAHGITSHAEALYHPAERFWAFQGFEAAIYVSLSVALLACAVWWIRRRIS